MSREIQANKGDDEILQRLLEQLSFDDWVKLRRGLALLDADDCPPTKRNTVKPLEPDPQKMTVANWPSNDEVSR